MAEMFGGNGRLLSTRRAKTDRTGRLRKMRRNILLERLEPRIVLDAAVTAIVSDTNVAFDWTGDTSADSLTVTYDDDSLYYTFSDPGHTIDVTPNSSIVIQDNDTGSVQVAPANGYGVSGISLVDGSNAGTPVSGNTYTIGSASGGLGTGCGVMVGPETGAVADMIDVGDASNPSSAIFAPLVTVDYTGAASAALTLDDSGNSSSATYAISDSQFSLNGTNRVDYTGSTISGLTLVTSDTGGNTVDVNDTPAAATTTIITNPAASTVDSVSLGSSAIGAGNAPASGLGAVSLSGGGSGTTTASVLDNNDGNSGENIALSSSGGIASLVFGSNPTALTFAGLADNGATAGLTIDGASGGDNWNVTGTPGNASTVLDTDPALTKIDTVTLGGSSSSTAAATLGDVTINDSGSGQDNVTVDDAADATGQTVAVTASSLTIGAAPVFTYSGADLSGLTFDGGTAANTVDVTGTSVGTTLAMGSSTSNAVNLGDASHAASNLTSVSITGTTELAVDDVADTTSQFVFVANTFLQMMPVSPFINYGGATLESLIFDSGTGSDTVDVNGTPAGITTTLAMGASTSNAVNLGGAFSAASTLGNVTVTGTTGLTIDDSADATGQTVAVTASSLTIGARAGLRLQWGNPLRIHVRRWDDRKHGRGDGHTRGDHDDAGDGRLGEQHGQPGRWQ